VMRGGSWADGDRPLVLASLRVPRAANNRSPVYGFRCVLSSRPAAWGSAVAPLAAAATPAVTPTSTFPTPAVPAIPTEVLHYGGHRYKLIITQGRAWPQARNEAAGMGGHLVTINSKPEAEWIAQTYVSVMMARAGRADSIYRVILGGFKEGAGKPWRWVTDEPFSMDTWVGKSTDATAENPGCLVWSILEGSTWAVMGMNDGIRSYIVEWDDAGAATPTPTVAAKASAPKAAGPPLGDPRRATKEAPHVNSLGMEFVPVHGTNVLFCIHETRYRDYAAFAAETAGVDGTWKYQGDPGTAAPERPQEHPVTKITWSEAKAFCDWLGRKEQVTYRLPSDREWSVAVGIDPQEAAKGAAASANVKSTNRNAYPWGDQWPPPPGSGNFAGDASDGFAATSPVMKFRPNVLGIYDLGGNVWELCEDRFTEAADRHVVRGGSYRMGDRVYLASAHRSGAPDASREADCGFRVVLEMPAR
jgi:formylglycine-generating enzyme required for sulfatase activity